jgi:sec-independent protein translocase protein TatC
VARLKPINFEDRLSLVEHLEELRARLIVSIATFGVAFGLCFWQNHLILDLVNRPLPEGKLPITFGVAEPFMTTLTVSAYAAILLSLPVILYQAYAFLLPAFSPRQQRTVLPLLLLVPFLFAAGVVFSYFVVLPAAIKFLLNFNDSEFNVQVRAREYYSFAALTLLSLGFIFQIPIGILAVTRLGVITPRQLSQNRRYAYVGIAIVAMALPGTDPVTMLIEMAPLLVLFELSVMLARLVERSSRRQAAPVVNPEGDSPAL